MRPLAVLGSTLLVVVTIPSEAAAVTTPGTTQTARGSTGTPVTGAGQLASSGDTAVGISVAQLSGGQALVAAGPGGALPSAVQFPAYVATGTYPRAVVRVAPTSGAGLDPGSSSFEFGAVLRLDRVSSGRSLDNGDNVFQRGLSSDASMFKLELDSGRPSCKVRGASGELTVRSATTVARGGWYTVRCSRTASQVAVEVSGYGSTTTTRTVGNGTTGALTFRAGQAASIGGKLNASGAIVGSATDQLNGAVAQVWTRRL